MTQDKEAHMHEAIARASLVAFAEFIGQPISDLDATFRQARGLYGNQRPIACVVKIPVDKTKPIEVTAVDGGSINDGVTLQDSSVVASYYLWKSDAKTFRSCTGGLLSIAPANAAELLATERTKLTPPPPKPEPIPFEAECRAHVKTLNAQLGINLSEDAVLAAGEAVRSITPRQSSDDSSTNYCLSIRKGDRAASFSAALGDPDRSKSRNSGVATWTTNYCACENGLKCALSDIVRNIPRILSQLTAPAKPVLTADSIRPSVTSLDRALAARQRPHFVFGDNTSISIDTDCKLFLDLLGGTVERLYLTFQSRSRRQTMHDTVPRAHVHTEPMPFPSEFNTTISAPVDPVNPTATLTALADRIKNENL